jgi:hypothetical protein
MNGPSMFSTAYACVNQPEREGEKENEGVVGVVLLLKYIGH